MAGETSFVQQLALPSGQELFEEKVHRVLGNRSTLAHRGSGRDDNAVHSGHDSGLLGK